MLKFITKFQNKRLYKKMLVQLDVLGRFVKDEEYNDAFRSLHYLIKSIKGLEDKEANNIFVILFSFNKRLNAYLLNKKKHKQVEKMFGKLCNQIKKEINK